MHNSIASEHLEAYMDAALKQWWDEILGIITADQGEDLFPYSTTATIFGRSLRIVQECKKFGVFGEKLLAMLQGVVHVSWFAAAIELCQLLISVRTSTLANQSNDSITELLLSCGCRIRAPPHENQDSLYQ